MLQALERILECCLLPIALVIYWNMRKSNKPVQSVHCDGGGKA